MIVVTTETVPGKRIVKTLGLARGNTVRARHLGKDIMAGLRNVVGGGKSMNTQSSWPRADLGPHDRGSQVARRKRRGWRSLHDIHDDGRRGRTLGRGNGGGGLRTSPKTRRGEAMPRPPQVRPGTDHAPPRRHLRSRARVGNIVPVLGSGRLGGWEERGLWMHVAAVLTRDKHIAHWPGPNNGIRVPVRFPGRLGCGVERTQEVSLAQS